MNENELAIIFAALLHDIGKVAERAHIQLPERLSGISGEAEYFHEAFSAMFAETLTDKCKVDSSTLQRIILKHHRPTRHDELLVSVADRLSAFERAEVERDREKTRGRSESVLQTVLSRIVLDSVRRPDGPRYYEVKPLSFDRTSLVPDKETHGSVDAYQALWQGLEETTRQTAQLDFASLLSTLRRFTLLIPSDSHPADIADVSLFQHLKTTAAIAACMLKFGLGEEDLKMLHDALVKSSTGARLSSSEEGLLDRDLWALVKGDISGTQDFLYLLTSSGAARGLRGRSFYLQMLTEMIADWILRESDLPATNLLFAGGGHFYLLLPYSETTERFANIRFQIAEKLWKAHKGDLSLNLEFVPVVARDLLEPQAGGNGFSGKWEQVSRLINDRKQRKWLDLGSDKMMDELFTPKQRGTTSEDTCQVCHNEGSLKVEDDVRKCQHCRQFEELGRLLRNPTHLIISTVPEAEAPEHGDWHDTLRAFGAEVRLVHTNESVQEMPSNVKTAIVCSLNRSDFLSEEAQQRFRWGDLPVSFDFRLLANVTPLKCNDAGEVVISEFGDLARASNGVKWLGVLRMDVDSLGDVFKNGLAQHATISRVSTLSESLRFFFEGWVPELCRQHNHFNPANGEGKDTLYLIYAGGDDLFVVGAWSGLPELAKQIREDFHAFVGGSHVTLSGGISLEHQKYPLYQLANDAKHALDNQAKEFKRPNNQHPKDAICFLQMPMAWEQFYEVAHRRNDILNMLKPSENVKKLPRAFLTRLVQIYALYLGGIARIHRLSRRESTSLEQVRQLIHFDKWYWQLIYQLNRFGQGYENHAIMIKDFQQAILREQDSLITVLHVLARWTELTTREE